MSLHDHSTRAEHTRHHRRGRLAAAVVAVLILVIIATVFGPSIAKSAASPTFEFSSTPAPVENSAGAAANPSHDVALEVVQPGREGLELSARLTDDGGLIELPIHWTIRNMEGETVYSSFNPGADAALPPGDYTVDIRYDAVRLSSIVTLLEGNRLMVSYVLNAGALRILPRVKDVGLPAARPVNRIFGLAGSERGKLVAVSEVPGEMLRIPQGDYRVESRFASGNVAAVIDVHVTAGRVSAVEIDHIAGLARLAFVGAPDQAVLWNVRDDAGQAIATAEGLNADVVLLPGTYTASARVGGETLSATFEIATGQARDIILGN